MGADTRVFLRLEWRPTMYRRTNVCVRGYKCAFWFAVLLLFSCTFVVLLAAYAFVLFGGWFFCACAFTCVCVSLCGCSVSVVFGSLLFYGVRF